MPNNTPKGANVAHTILRLPAVLRERGRSRSAHYLDIQQGLFTRPVTIGARAVGWPSDEVSAINAARIAGKRDEEIRALVIQLESSRKAAS
jgi:prophage regulatory protein